MKTHVKDFDLEQYLLGELKPEKKREIEKLLAESAELKNRLEMLKKHNETFLEENPARWMTHAIKVRADQQELKRAVPFKMPLGMASALLIVLFAFVIQIRPPENSEILQELSSSTRTKGEGFKLKLYREQVSGKELLIDSADAKAGDRIVLLLNRDEFTHGMVFSIDGSGVLTTHFPDSSSSSFLGEKAQIQLPFVYELDEAPSYEKFYFVGSKQELNQAEVIENVLAGSWQGELDSLVLLKKEQGKDD